VTGFDLKQFLESEGLRVDEALERALRPGSIPDSVREPIRYAVRGGGKRLRPILLVAAYRSIRPEVPVAVYDLAAALELIHTYSLVHDDLPAMDDDPFRRGRPSTHVAFGVRAAAVAGAAVIPLSLRVARDACRRLEIGSALRREVLVPLYAAAGAGGMIGGQVLDLEAEGSELSMRELEAIHRRKTGALLAVAPRMGAAAAGADPDSRDALHRYGTALGLAFQITDDILDVTGTTAVLGKTAGRDGELRKATFAGIAGVEPARERARDEVRAALAALEAGSIRSSELVALARFAAERDR
jgi:geranylgeranyl diphosphate synthase, type II